MADLVQSEVGWFNGWWVPEENERESCEKAAERIIKYLKRRVNEDKKIR